jgi:hypothetical protein
MCVQAQWQQSSNGISSMAYDFIEGDSGVILAGTSQGIYRSDNNGDLWVVSNEGIQSGDNHIVCFTKISDRLFAGGNSIYYSTDNGISWTISNNTGYDAKGFAVLSSEVFVATMGEGVLKSDDNGETWISANVGIPTDSIYSIVRKGNLLFVGTVRNGLYMSANGGTDWSAVNTGIPLPVTVRTIETDGDRLFAGTRRNDLFPGSPANGILVSADDGGSWTQLSMGVNGVSPIAWVSDIYSLGDGAVLASVSGAVRRSLNNGENWSVFTDGVVSGVAGFYATANYVFCGVEGFGNVYRIARSEVLVTSIGSIPEEEWLILSPNPASSTVKFGLAGQEVTHVSMTDMAGREVLRTSAVEMDVSHLPSGIYTVTATMPDGSVLRQRLVVH